MSPFPQYYFPSSSSPYHQPPPPPPPPPPTPPPPPPPMLITQNDNIFLHQNHPYDPLFCLANAQIPETLINLGVSNCPSTTTTNIMTSTTATTTKQDHVIVNNTNAGLDPNFLSKRPVKKDRHSKIYTAQGLRDRRVRLSIDIAREFFDLHDMLGFDKASKTLEWLLTKSKKAIKELSRGKLRSTDINSTTTLSSTNSECEQAPSESPDNDNNNLEEGMSLAPKSKVLKEKLDMETLSESDLMTLLAKESRARARARARARTKEKRHDFCTTTKRSNYNVGQCGSSSQISNQFGTIRSPNPGLNHGTGDRDQEEPVVMIRRKIRFPSISSDYVDHHARDRDHDQGQLFCEISKGEASNNVVYSCPSLLLTQNWDNINNSSSNNIRTASPHPSFCLPT